MPGAKNSIPASNYGFVASAEKFQHFESASIILSIPEKRFD
jgi:hypothetical protein